MPCNVETHLLVDLLGTSQILSTANLRLNQVVAVNSRGSLNVGETSAHELEDSHLRSGILASDTIGAELEVGGSTLDVLSVRVVQMRVEDLLSESERAVQPGPDNREVLAHLPVQHKNVV